MAFDLKIGAARPEVLHEALGETDPPKLDGGSKDPGFEGGADNHNTAQAKDLPKAPIDDSIGATVLKQSLLQSKDAQLDAERTKIASQMQEADQKYQNSMDAAAIGIVLGTVAETAGGDPAPATQAKRRDDDTRAEIPRNW